MDFEIEKILSICISFLFVFNIFFFKKLTEEWIHPSVLINTLWSLYFIIPQIIILNHNINPISIIYVYFCVTIFSVSAMIFNWRNAYNFFRNNKSNDLFKSFNSKLLIKISILISSLSILFTAKLLINNGLDFFSESGLLIASGQLIAMKANEGFSYGFLGILSTTFTYSAAILCGIAYQKNSNKKIGLIMLLFGFAPAFFSVIAQSSKLSFLLSFLFFVSGALAVRMHSNNSNSFKFKSIVKIVVSILIAFPAIIFSFLSRGQFSNFDDIQVILDFLVYAMKSYSLGQVYAFSDFFSYYIGHSSQSEYIVETSTYGAYSFNSILNLFGYSKEFPPGKYEESLSLPYILETNIFTLFRDLITDFGLIGTAIFFTILGFCINFLFYKFLYHKNSVLLFLIFIGFFVFIGMSYLYSVFVARYMISVLLITFLILKINLFIFKFNKQFSVTK